MLQLYYNVLLLISWQQLIYIAWFIYGQLEKIMIVKPPWKSTNSCFFHFDVKTLNATVLYMYFTLHSYCVLGREFIVNYEWYPRDDLARVLICSSKYTLFLRTCNSTRRKVTWENIFIRYSCWLLCFKIHNHSVSRESKKYSEHE